MSGDGRFLEQIRTALDELTPLLDRRVVDIEMARLTVGADATTLQRALVAVIGRAAEHTEGPMTVRTTKQGTAARIEVMGEYPREHPAASGWPAALAVDVEAIDGRLGGGDAAVVCAGMSAFDPYTGTVLVACGPS